MKSEISPGQSKEAIRFVLNLMENNLPERLTYHSVEHTRRVLSEAEYIGQCEGASEQSLILLSLAAAFHDSGYLVDPYCHEERGCDLARKYLPDFGFDEQQIEDVCNLIMATKIPTHPDGLLQNIICDADLNYLGTEEYEEIADLLYNEFKAYGITDSHEKWIIQQITFMENHRFFTNTAKNRYDPTKAKNLERLRRNIRN